MIGEKRHGDAATRRHGEEMELGDGRASLSRCFRILAGARLYARATPRRPTIASPRLLSAGFTLLELIIVISIIIILVMVVIPQYQRVTLYGREAVLRQNLNEMRKMLDQYSADKGKLPQSLDDLVSAGYLRDIPVDPITGERDWFTETGPDPFSADTGSGIVNVRSSSPNTSSEGTPYNQW